MNNPFKPTSLRRGIGSSAILSVAGRGIGYLRQLQIAYFFGITRNLDVYYMAYSIATLCVLPITALFDQVAVPHLVRLGENHADEGRQSLNASLLSISLVLSGLMSLIFVLTLPLTIGILAHGFSAPDKINLRKMALLFLPWIALSFPYSALNALFKSFRYYSAVLFAEFFVSLISTLALFVWHTSPSVLPLTLAAAYAGALLMLAFFGRHFIQLGGKLWTDQVKPLYRNFVELIAMNQFGSLSTAVDRFLQSYLIPGSISAFNFGLATIMPVNDLISFKELYIVSLSSHENRKEKLERLLGGLILLSVPIALFFFQQSQLVIQVLYERGRFGGEARMLTGRVFALLALGLVSGALGAPVGRMFPILDRIKFTGKSYLAYSATLAFFGGLFVLWMKWDVYGLALAFLLSSIVSLGVQMGFLRHLGVAVSLKHLASFAGVALLASVCGLWAIRWLPTSGPSLIQLAVKGLAFAAMVGLVYLPVRHKIIRVLYG